MLREFRRGLNFASFVYNLKTLISYFLVKRAFVYEIYVGKGMTKLSNKLKALWQKVKVKETTKSSLEIERQLVKVPLATTVSQYLISPTQSMKCYMKLEMGDKPPHR